MATDSVVAAEVAEDKECYLQAISKDGPVIAFLFRCRHCGTHLAYSDFS
ncbi:CbrC family protein [Micromonospora globbae]|uniref:CbrC family protein n=1 Tax=Micromonospora globbae TaxID=1894969 RepID=A0ABZ1SB17_9ACTN|nr:CbrC family protein [Micromonospora globbae]